MYSLLDLLILLILGCGFCCRAPGFIVSPVGTGERKTKEKGKKEKGIKTDEDKKEF